MGHRLVDHHYRSGHGNEGLLERLRDVCFTVSEEAELSAVKVLERVRRSFNVEKVTKSFFREFKDHHEQLAEHIEGIPRPDDQRWYASVLMNRLMFVYFIRFLLPLFHEGLGSPPAARSYDDSVIEEIIGEVPYVNGGIFEQNLDLAALMADYLYALGSADECQRAFEVLRSLTVCDPTVGSGAFLLAALDVLDPLYTAVFNRAEEIAAGGGGGGCPAFLDEARFHHSMRYWLLKTLCLNNLYGVDLMAEAAEIAKLRLLLKLAAQLDDPAQIEPLPDLDFNIKSGNLLVGIAERDDITRRFSDRGVLPFGLEEIEDAVESIAQALHDYITENDSKVLLLTATPYNKGFADVAAQIALFVGPDDDLGIRPERAIAEHGEAEFAGMCEGRTSTLAAFEASEHLGDWQDLMSQFLVRRTRRFIQDNYAYEDENGRPYLTFGDGRTFHFPEREAFPVEREVAPSDPAAAMMSQSTIDAIADLLLPRYNLARYLDPRKAPTDDEQAVIDDLRNSANGNLSGFNRIMMFKRLTSSGPAFLATLRRHALRNLVALHGIDYHLPLPVGSVDNALWSAELDAQEGDLFEEGLFSRDEVPDLSLLNEFGAWDAKSDGKIASLVDVITQTHPVEKVLVFTEAADTAAYVAEELDRRGVKGVAAVTGDSENPTALACRFSPRANQGVTVAQGQSELRVLISTDVLSEGQNLQDARIVVNYDLPWAIVRLVQRAGRVDRIGQQAATVVIYSGRGCRSGIDGLRNLAAGDGKPSRLRQAGGVSSQRGVCHDANSARWDGRRRCGPLPDGDRIRCLCLHRH